MVKLAAGSPTQTVVPFTGLNFPEGVAVDTAGNVYVSDTLNNTGAELAAGSSTKSVLPFAGLASPGVWRWIPPAASTPPTTATIGC